MKKIYVALFVMLVGSGVILSDDSQSLIGDSPSSPGAVKKESATASSTESPKEAVVGDCFAQAYGCATMVACKAAHCIDGIADRTCLTDGIRKLADSQFLKGKPGSFLNEHKTVLRRGIVVVVMSCMLYYCWKKFQKSDNKS